MRVLFFLLLVLSACQVDAKECTGVEAQEAEAGVDTLKDWSAIYTAFKRYGHCDDGGIAEGWSEAVVHLLASNWGSLKQAAVYTTNDKGFRRFFLKHIDASADTDEIKSIGKLAGSQCPPNLKLLCKEIEASVTEASSQLINEPL